MTTSYHGYSLWDPTLVSFGVRFVYAFQGGDHRYCRLTTRASRVVRRRSSISTAIIRWCMDASLLCPGLVDFWWSNKLEGDRARIFPFWKYLRRMMCLAELLLIQPWPLLLHASLLARTGHPRRQGVFPYIAARCKLNVFLNNLFENYYGVVRLNGVCPLDVVMCYSSVFKHQNNN